MNQGKEINMQNDTNMTLDQLKSRVRKFIRDRDWEKYHNPKDIAESICIEAGELLEQFQWVAPQETLDWKNDASKLESIKVEIADVLIYCLSMANALEINLAKTVMEKIESNERKYPVEKYRGRAFVS